MSKNKKIRTKKRFAEGISRSTFFKISGALAGSSLLAVHSYGISDKNLSLLSEAEKDSATNVSATASNVTPGPERVAADPTRVPPPVKHTVPKTHEITIHCHEVTGEIEDGKYFQYMLFNGQVPAPMIRVRQGDTINLTITNSDNATHPHNVDFHAVYGPGGGAEATLVGPGQTKHLRFKTMYPGAFIYHCAVPNLDYHISSGMYGLILVEPPQGLPPVDHEFYFGQNEIYVYNKDVKPKERMPFNFQTLADENPQYVVLNGESQAITKYRYGSLKVKKGESARIYFVNGGPNLISNFHAIGNVWTKVWRGGAIINKPEQFLQTVGVSPGSCAVVDMEFPVPGTIKLVDHALSRVVHKGLLALIDVEGTPEPEIFNPNPR